MGMPRGVIHSTAEPEWAMSRALSVSQRCGSRTRLRARPVLGSQVSLWGTQAKAGTRGTHLDGPGAREHLLEAVEHLAHQVVRGFPHELLGRGGETGPP